ncbi:LytR/AlgR family response regulator transcription factor [Flavobacterium sp. FlaQc-50]|uniref:LytR/AlgR family response regulator transcription factor n=1 Tax=unclassified Flavobacterium TaxID=196869 RepID=UPI0037581369
MKKTQLYTLILLSISVVVLTISLISSQYLYSLAKENLWNLKLESGERETREISRLLQEQLRSGLSKTQVINNLQISIQNTDTSSDFICMYNREGIELCHPNPALIGIKIQEDNSQIKRIKDTKVNTLRVLLQKGERSNGLRVFPNNSNRSSEIVNIYPVTGTDWMVASHANISVLEKQLSDMHLQFVLSLLLSTLIIVICCYTCIRLIYRKYQTAIDFEIKNLNDKVSELQILNIQLNTNQEKLLNHPKNPVAKSLSNDNETLKKRILTYHKDELVKLDTNDIAYVFLNNGVTYINTFENRQFNSNNSLDEIIRWLDQTSFYRANRQFIINIRAIKTILLYGKNQLKLIIKSEVNMDIIISKNKVADFKLWLDQ